MTDRNRISPDHPLILKALARKTITPEQIAALPAPGKGKPARSHKYNAQPTEDAQGWKHPSKLQARVTDCLRASCKAVIPEVSIPLSPRPKDRIRIDALVITDIEPDGSFSGYFAEIKGMDLGEGKQKRRRFEDAYGVSITLIRK
jgi:hypothetical protein